MAQSAGRLGWLLVWGVVFCDIGSSVFYVPGVLYGADGEAAGFFVLATMVGFMLLAAKEVEVARRYPAGGGVVSLAGQAFGPWWGSLGGQLILVDFFLTVAISALAGVHYLDLVLPLGEGLLPLTLLALVALTLINIVGVKESARVSLVLAITAVVVELLVVVVALAQVPPTFWAEIPEELAALLRMSPWQGLVGYAGAWLAFSGLESFSQLAPAMKDLDLTPRRAMVAVVASVLVTAPSLTFLAIASLPLEIKAAESSRFVAALASVWGGVGLQVVVVLLAMAMLFLAANTAILGSYHVQLALTRQRFLPEALGALSHRYQTPHRAILLATVVPAVILIAVGADLRALGGLYAFGLLGAFMLSSAGIDLLRWREGRRDWVFFVGVFTTLLVMVAFGVNHVAKPEATTFGGALAGLGMLASWLTRSGTTDALLNRLPYTRRPEAAELSEAGFYTLERAAARAGDVPGVMVASRGATRKIFKEAVDRAKARGCTHLFVLYVDEVPGLFYPQLASPTPEGQTVLDAGAAIVQNLGLEPIPVWTLSHSAAEAVATAAVTCRCDTVVIGATQRTFLWNALRGRFIRDALKHLPAEVRLIVVG